MIPPQRPSGLLGGMVLAAALLLEPASAFTAHPRPTTFSTRSSLALSRPSEPSSPAPFALSSSSSRGRSGAVAVLRSSPSADPSSSGDGSDNTVRGKLRQLTGFSLTAFRATMRATTGFSLTALRAACRVATGISVTGTMKWILGLFPTWFRYFLQPFLVLYYAPLMIVRAWVGPTKTARAEALAAHERVVEGWKDAVRVAEGAQEGGYRPVHVDDDGNIVAALPPEPDLILGNFDASPNIGDEDLANAVFESVEYAESRKEEEKTP